MTAKELGKKHIRKREGGRTKGIYHWPLEHRAPCLKPLLAHAGFIRSLRLNNDDNCVQSLLSLNNLLERGDLLPSPVSMV